MSLPDSSPKLSRWFFLATDALLIAVAAFIAANSERPLSLAVVLAIVGCVVVGALITCAALIADYARRQEDGFDDRQHALEALSRTVATSAEQISIATAGLNELTDLAHKNLKHAEQLPSKLQEKINDFTRQLNEVDVTENETLQHEINALRAAEAEKIEAAGDKIAKAVAELTKLEAATAKHLAATSEALAKLPDSLAKARREAEQALLAAQATALRALETKFATLARDGETKDTALPASVTKATELEPVPVKLVVEPESAPSAPSAPTVATHEETPIMETTFQTEPTWENIVAPAVVEETKPSRPRAPRKAKLDELNLPMPGDMPAGMPTASPTKTAADDFAQTSPDDSTPASAVSTDGATRLLVTAYIGIGNRLFIRGDGPGLSADQGVPLQFVSIGKWRWETNHAVTAVRVRIYKNDETECAALGELTLEPARQTEVTANF
jgi:chemotaxis protein histidine kinase CheA